MQLKGTYVDPDPATGALPNLPREVPASYTHTHGDMAYNRSGRRPGPWRRAPPPLGTQSSGNLCQGLPPLPSKRPGATVAVYPHGPYAARAEVVEDWHTHDGAVLRYAPWPSTWPALPLLCMQLCYAPRPPHSVSAACMCRQCLPARVPIRPVHWPAGRRSRLLLLGTVAHKSTERVCPSARNMRTVAVACWDGMLSFGHIAASVRGCRISNSAASVSFLSPELLIDTEDRQRVMSQHTGKSILTAPVTTGAASTARCFVIRATFPSYI
jgi:hypothetical protein